MFFSRSLALCREVIEGLRIYFDFTVNDLLLYAAEKNQYVTSTALTQPMNVIKTE